MNRFDRVVSIFVLLQTKNVIKAKAISERFDISLRTVYRDIKTLKHAGVPVIGDPGIGYSLVEGYRIPPVMFTEKETNAMLTAEKFIGRFTEGETEAAYSSAMMKIKAMLRSSEKQSLATLEDSISVADDKHNENKAYLQDLFKGIAGKHVLEIEYKKADGTVSERKLEPIGCYHRYNNWYLVAFCQKQQDYRTFKVNRIANLQVLPTLFTTKRMSLQNYIDNQTDSWKAENQFYDIEVTFNHTLVQFTDIRKYHFGFVSETIEKDVVHMKFRNPSIEMVARWLLQFGDQARAIAPIELTDRMKTLAANIHKHYQ